MPSSHLILCRPLLLLPPTPPSIRVFSNESTLHMSWPKYWSFSFSTSPSSEHPGLISFRMDWLQNIKRLLWSHTGLLSRVLAEAKNVSPVPFEAEPEFYAASSDGCRNSHQLTEFTQTHAHRVDDAIQPPHPLSSPFSSCPQSLPASDNPR